MSEMYAVTSTELGELPADWPVQRFDSLFAVQQGKQVSKTNRIGENQRPFLRTKNVFWGKLDLSDLDEMHFTDAEEKRLTLHPGDLLVCEGGDIGRTAIWNDALPRCYYQNHLHRARLRDKGCADSQFALYWLWYGFEIGSVYFGRGNVTTIPNLSQSKLCELPLPVPPLSEQRNIAGVLGVVQRAMEQQARLLALTAELKKTLLHKLFTEGLRGEPQKPTEIGPVPESWEVVPLGSLATKISKGSSPRWQGFEYVSEGVLFVRSQNVGAGRMDFSDRVFLSPKFNEQEKRSILKNEDILINLVGASIGRVALGTPEIEGANCNQAVGFVRMDCRRSFKDFLVAFLLSPAGQQQMFFQKKDIARANLSLLDLKTFKVPVPPTAEVEEIAEVFLQIEAKLAIHQHKHATLTALFRTLLHQLMTAQIRVHDLDLKGLLAQAGAERDSKS